MRSIRALPAILVGAAATMIAHAQVAEGIFIPAPGSAMPNYFSGTNCRASGYAQVGEPIFLAQLSLNGEMVRDWALGSDPEEVPPMDFFVKVMFNSSHFANGTPVNVKYRVWTFPSGWWEGNSDPDPIVKNKLMMFEHPDSNLSPDAAPVVNGLMSGQNYVLHQINGGTWPETDYFSGLSGSNAVFYAGHGTPLSHQDGTSTDSMTPSEYESHRISQIGSGIPPFNTGAPPVNFCHLLACNCGDSNAFTTVCFPYYMAWGGPWMENQALMAYTVYVVLQQMHEHANLIWNQLSLGWTAWRTYLWFNNIWLSGHPEELKVWDDLSEDPRYMKPGDLALYCNYAGDHGAMRIKSVYTGTQVLPIGWFMPL